MRAAKNCVARELAGHGPPGEEGADDDDDDDDDDGGGGGAPRATKRTVRPLDADAADALREALDPNGDGFVTLPEWKLMHMAWMDTSLAFDE